MAKQEKTKQVIAAGFKSLMNEKAFDKITVSDITSRCGLNRQTFYYHFQDKYDLFTWILQREALISPKISLNIYNWSEAIYRTLSVMKRDRYFYINAFKSSGKEEFVLYLEQSMALSLKQIIADTSHRNMMNPGDRDFVIEFYTFGTVGIIVDWILDGMKTSPEVLKERFENLIVGTKSSSVDMWFSDGGQNN